MGSAVPQTSSPKILFVCVGNVCRSAALEYALKKKFNDKGLKNFEVDSAGISAYAGGAPRDPDTVRIAREFGIEINGVSRPFIHDDFEHFDYIYATTDEVLHTLKNAALSSDEEAKVDMATCFTDKKTIPSPVGHSDERYREVLKIIVNAADGIAEHFCSN